MRKFSFDDGTHLYVGEPEEIKPLYRSMERAFNSDKSDFCPMYCDIPRFNPMKLYGLVVDENNFFYVISEHVALHLILDGVKVVA